MNIIIFAAVIEDHKGKRHQFHAVSEDTLYEELAAWVRPRWECHPDKQPKDNIEAVRLFFEEQSTEVPAGFQHEPWVLDPIEENWSEVVSCPYCDREFHDENPPRKLGPRHPRYNSHIARALLPFDGSVTPDPTPVVHGVTCDSGKTAVMWASHIGAAFDYLDLQNAGGISDYCVVAVRQPGAPFAPEAKGVPIPAELLDAIDKSDPPDMSAGKPFTYPIEIITNGELCFSLRSEDATNDMRAIGILMNWRCRGRVNKPLTEDELYGDKYVFDYRLPTWSV